MEITVKELTKLVEISVELQGDESRVLRRLPVITFDLEHIIEAIAMRSDAKTRELQEGLPCRTQ